MPASVSADILQASGNPWVSESPDTPVEIDPRRRYLRYPQVLGRGACKRVYKAFDQVDGIEVAWNQVELNGSGLPADVKENLFAEIKVLKTLKHKNIITFYDWWFDSRNQTINFITELFTSGTLRQYRKKHRQISTRAIKRWAWEILEGLVYLHGHTPPIVHRDIKCDNVFVNGTSGQIKIGDLGLATAQKGLSVVGTPEFMAPEIYEETYDEKVDIYSFGMCLLELATLEYPYSECHSVPAIFRKVTQGIPPLALARVMDSELQELIKLCLAFDPAARPSAVQLLKHPFFELPRTEHHSHWSGLGGLTPNTSSGSLSSLGAEGSPRSPRRRGRTVCLAQLKKTALGRSDAEADSSDDEVLLPLSAVHEKGTAGSEGGGGRFSGHFKAHCGARMSSCGALAAAACDLPLDGHSGLERGSSGGFLKQAVAAAMRRSSGGGSRSSSSSEDMSKLLGTLPSIRTSVTTSLMGALPSVEEDASQTVPKQLQAAAELRCTCYSPQGSDLNASATAAGGGGGCPNERQSQASCRDSGLHGRHRRLTSDVTNELFAAALLPSAGGDLTPDAVPSTADPATKVRAIIVRRKLAARMVAGGMPLKRAVSWT